MVKAISNIISLIIMMVNFIKVLNKDRVYKLLNTEHIEENSKEINLTEQDKLHIKTMPIKDIFLKEINTVLVNY